jgi:hypothetical protein
MKNWKTKLFGDNRMNFYGWLCVGLLLFLVSIGGALLSVKLSDTRYGVLCLLTAIWMLIAGIFGIALQNYLARVAKNIEDEDKRKETDHDA